MSHSQGAALLCRRVFSRGQMWVVTPWTNQQPMNLARLSRAPRQKGVYGRGQSTVNIEIKAPLMLIQWLYFDERGIFLQFGTPNTLSRAAFMKRNDVLLCAKMTSTPNFFLIFCDQDFFLQWKTQHWAALMASFVTFAIFWTMRQCKHKELALLSL